MTATQSYIGVHVYYSIDSIRSLLLDCVEPLVEELEQTKLLSSYFFIRYWEGGPHIRLRLLPASNIGRNELQEIVNERFRTFLANRPSHFEPVPELFALAMRTLYIMEHGQGAGQSDAPQKIDLVPNNTFRYVEYSREYGRYGGDKGVELAEEHFDFSSRIALRVLRESNTHMRSSLLGMSFQLMLYSVFAFWGTRERTAQFFERYPSLFPGAVDQVNEKNVQKAYQSQLGALGPKLEGLEEMLDYLLGSEVSALAKFTSHARGIRGRIEVIYNGGELLLQPAAQSADTACARLLGSYIHMLNNRLGVLIPEEIYLSKIIAKCLGNR